MTEYEREQLNKGFGMLYNVKKPAHLGDGLSSGIGNMGKGVLAGGAALIGLTVVGA